MKYNKSTGGKARYGKSIPVQATTCGRKKITPSKGKGDPHKEGQQLAPHEGLSLRAGIFLISSAYK